MYYIAVSAMFGFIQKLYKQCLTPGEMKKRLAELVRTFRTEIGMYRSILRDPRCPRLARWLLGGALAYAVSPIDLIPDFIPVIGHLDDLIVLPLLVWLAFRVIPRELVQEHKMNLRET